MQSTKNTSYDELIEMLRYMTEEQLVELMTDILITYCKESFGKEGITYQQHAESLLENIKSIIEDGNNLSKKENN